MIEVDPTALESTIRRTIVEELRGSAFLHCDVNKEHVLLCVKHGTNLIEAWKCEATWPQPDAELKVVQLVRGGRHHVLPQGFGNRNECSMELITRPAGGQQ